MFKELNINDLNINVFNKLNKDWALITANNKDEVNTMTISWGGFGVLWNKNVCTIYVRDSRYTKKFIDNSEYFTISFYDDIYKDTLKYLGTVSGSREDKINKCNLNKVINGNTAYFEEANMVLICKKLYCDTLDKDKMLDESIKDFYKTNDYHTMYIGEIKNILIK